MAEHILEVTSRELIDATNANANRVADWHHRFHAELEAQRNEVRAELLEALREASSEVKLEGWSRCVKYQYANTPLSAVGSLRGCGGRFNVPNTIDRRAFSALYLASKKSTALAEMGQVRSVRGLSAAELALTNPESSVEVVVRAQLDDVVDLRNLKSLAPFLSIIRKFKVSTALKKEAMKLGMPGAFRVVQRLNDLKKVLLAQDWRFVPTQFDLPASSQIFGGLAFSAGLQGICYPSKYDGECIAIYPQNLRQSSFVEIIHQAPETCAFKRLDWINWQQAEVATR